MKVYLVTERWVNSDGWPISDPKIIAVYEDEKDAREYCIANRRKDHTLYPQKVEFIKRIKHKPMTFGVVVLRENLAGVLADPVYGGELKCSCGKEWNHA